MDATVKTKNVVGERSGSVILVNLSRSFAPSRRAAS